MNGGASNIHLEDLFEDDNHDDQLMQLVTLDDLKSNPKFSKVYPVVYKKVIDAYKVRKPRRIAIQHLLRNTLADQFLRTDIWAAIDDCRIEP